MQQTVKETTFARAHFSNETDEADRLADPSNDLEGLGIDFDFAGWSDFEELDWATFRRRSLLRVDLAVVSL